MNNATQKAIGEKKVLSYRYLENVLHAHFCIPRTGTEEVSCEYLLGKVGQMEKPT